MAAVRIDNLSKRFGGTAALSRVSLEVAPGEICFLLGPSGCGKTTLLRAVVGFVEPDEGGIYIDGALVTGVPPHKRGAAMMFQSYALWPHLTVERNVAFGLEERGVAKGEIAKRVGEVLGMMRISEYANRRIHELSGGQQQRVALARALVVQPRCLLLDEPLSNLDSRLRVEMRGEIRRLCKQFGLTAIYVSHDQKEALAIGDRVAVMDAGRIRQVGPPLEVYRRPQSRFVAEFLGETNLLEGQASGRTVSTAVGIFEAAAEAAGPVLLSIRPEAWRLGSEPGPFNSLPGRIAETVYLGEMARHRLALESGRELIVYELNPRPRDGATVYATVDPVDVIAILEP
ncbi:MAG: ABC transporter ATP-binding protein [Chthoniobacteraceae bacterium]|jgi:iron(III) transport system ATP-binding protein